MPAWFLLLYCQVTLLRLNNTRGRQFETILYSDRDDAGWLEGEKKAAQKTNCKKYHNNQKKSVNRSRWLRQ